MAKRRVARRKGSRACGPPQFEPLEPRCLLSLVVTIDYTLDTNNFFNTQAKKDLLQFAADTIASRLDDTLAAILPSGSNTWTAHFTHPGTGGAHSIMNMGVDENEIIVFAGGQVFAGSTLGMGGPGGWSASGTTQWRQTVKGRGQPGASSLEMGVTDTDFGPWGGSITFDLDSNWHFGMTTDGLGAGEADFLSVAFHELFHLFGFVSGVESFTRFIVDGFFTGPAATAEYDQEGSPPMAGSSHWAENLMDNGQEAAMTPTITLGTRKLPTPLDYAALADLGWELNSGLPTVSIDDVQVAEGHSGTTAFVFTVTLSSASASNVMVDFTTANGTATAGTDFTGISGTLTILAGETSGQITVEVNGDTTVEFDETFFVNLSNPVNATLDDAQGLGTILNDDQPLISINDVSLTEGHAGTKNFVFTVTLDRPSVHAVMVDFATANGSATAPGDYTATSGTLTITAGNTSGQITVTVNGDTTVELDETFTVNLSNAVNAMITDSQGLGTILNDDQPLITINDVSLTEGNAGTKDFVFTVMLDRPSIHTVMVDFATANGTASAGSDYVATSGTLAITAGNTSGQIAVIVNGDATVEHDETFTVSLSNPVNAAITDDQGVGTILNDDPVVVTIVAEENPADEEGPLAGIFRVSRTGPTDVPLDVTYSIGGTAGNGTDYDLLSGELTIPAGQASATISIAPIDDAEVEGSEIVVLTITSGGTYIAGSPDNATITILDNDVRSVSINSVVLAEGDAGQMLFTFTVTLNQVHDEDVMVDFATADGTAEAGIDYTAASGTVTISAGETTAQILVAVHGDTQVEFDETFVVDLSNPVNAVIGLGQGTGTILNDDQPLMSINDVSLAEGDAGMTAFMFTVSLDRPSVHEVMVDFETADGTATAGDDHTAAMGTLTIPAGETSGQVIVQVTGDTTVEHDEIFVVHLSNAVNAVIDQAMGVGTILNDDQPLISIDDVSLQEGDAATTAFVFTVTLDRPSVHDVMVDFETADGTATAGDDYTPAMGTLTIPAGETSGQITVQVTGDTAVEFDEIFSVNLSNAMLADIEDAQGAGTILNDDQPLISIDDVSLLEGDSGTTAFVFTVTVDRPSVFDVMVDFATANGTAGAGSDYTAAMGTLTIPAGGTSGQITVLVNGDTVVELDETFAVNLSSPVNAAIDDGQGLGMILNDDQPLISIDDVSLQEGDAGTTPFVFTVTLDRPSVHDVMVDFETVGASAMAGDDFTVASGTLTIPAGDTSGEIAVVVHGDTAVEFDETFFVNLSSAVNAAIDEGMGTGTIVNDDQPLISIDDVSLEEGDTGMTAFVFTVVLDRVSVLDVRVDFATVNGSAIAGSDYVAASGTLTIPAGALSGQITVLVNGDTAVEFDEAFTVNLSNAVNGAVDDDQGAGTILNDDHPLISIDDVSLEEGDAGTTNFVFTVTLDRPSVFDVRVDFATADGTAMAGTDYVAHAGTLVIAAGETSAQITVMVVGDTDPETHETFFADLSNPVNATVSDGRGTGTILSDDLPLLSISDVARAEGDAGVPELVFTVTLSEPSLMDVMVDFATLDDSAVAGEDYIARAGTLTILAGQTSGQIAVQVIGEKVIEPDEMFFVDLSNALNAVIADARGAGTILNDDGVDLALHFAGIKLFDTIVPGDKGSAKVAVTNIGNVAANGLGTLVLLASTDESPDAGDIVLRELADRPLKIKPGKTKNVTVKFTVPLDAPLGEYFLIAALVSGEEIGDLDPANDAAVSEAAVPLVYRFGSFDGRRNVKLTLAGPGEVPTTFQLRGNGLGEVGGDLAAFFDVTLIDTDASSILKLKTPRGTSTVLRNVAADGGVKNILAPTGRVFGGTWELPGPMKVLKLHDIEDSVLDVLDTVRTVKLGAVMRSELNLDAVKLFTAQGMSETLLTAESIRNLKLKAPAGSVLPMFIDSFLDIVELHTANLGWVQTESSDGQPLGLDLGLLTGSLRYTDALGTALQLQAADLPHINDDFEVRLV